MRSKTINIVLRDGTPYGIRTAELSGWDGKVIICPRAGLKKLRELPEAAQPAVYFLSGKNDEMYVGETDELSARLANHALKKDFWEDMIAVTSPKLFKTEVKYLEHVFVKRLKKDGLVHLNNSGSPQQPNMKDELVDVLDEFVDRVSDILLALGYRFMGASDELEKDAAQSGIAVVCKASGADAFGVWSENGLLVQAGSLARISSVASMHEGYEKLRDTMKKAGLLVSNGEHLVLQKDHLFASPSAAAAVMMGRSANGLMEWKTKEEKTIKELEIE